MALANEYTYWPQYHICVIYKHWDSSGSASFVRLLWRKWNHGNHNARINMKMLPSALQYMKTWV